jgi:predicted thioredoxin/glutaredoxin
LGERFKICVKCRAYKLDNRERILKQGRERAKDDYEENKEELLQNKKQYREHNKDKTKEKSTEVIECKMCGSMVRNWGMARHMRTNKCNIKASKT